MSHSNVEEKTEIFRISTATNEIGDWSVDDLRLVPIHTNLMDSSPFCDEVAVHALWFQKSRMDKVFDDKFEKAYYLARDTKFPQDKHGSAFLGNRAGDKLMELSDAGRSNDIFINPPPEIRDQLILRPETIREASQYDDSPSGVPLFIDICGGPGSWSEYLIKLKYECANGRVFDGVNPRFDVSLPPATLVPCHGIGFTLKTNEESQCNWYKSLTKYSKFTVVEGPFQDGDVYNPENVYACTEAAEKLGGRGVMLAVADGGFRVSKNEKGEHIENLQELYSIHIIMSELFVALNVLQKEGNFVCKMFDTFSAATASVLWIASRLFKEVAIIKPFKSRIVNSERYLVAKGLKSRTSEEYLQLRSLLEAIHSKWFNEVTTAETIFETLIPMNVLCQDHAFVQSVLEMNIQLAGKQTKALDKVMDEVDRLINDGFNTNNNNRRYAPSSSSSHHHQQNPSSAFGGRRESHHQVRSNLRAGANQQRYSNNSSNDHHLSGSSYSNSHRYQSNLSNNNIRNSAKSNKFDRKSDNRDDHWGRTFGGARERSRDRSLDRETRVADDGKRGGSVEDSFGVDSSFPSSRGVPQQKERQMRDRDMPYERDLVIESPLFRPANEPPVREERLSRNDRQRSLD